jgi:hypothetical protein
VEGDWASGVGVPPSAPPVSFFVLRTTVAAPMTDTMRIYVALLDEAVDVWRPVDATHLGADRYRILTPNETSGDERWEFEQGALVKWRACTFADGTVGLVAFERIAE